VGENTIVKGQDAKEFCVAGFSAPAAVEMSTGNLFVSEYLFCFGL
jgi:hypothetical protein